MAERPTPDSIPWCPSAPVDAPGSVALGVVGGTAQAPRVGYFVELLPLTDVLIALSAPADPTEVFRLGAPCFKSACVHFGNNTCRLATRIVDTLPEVVDDLPACRLRPRCRWWQQEGKPACLRCPQVVTETFDPTSPLAVTAKPSAA